ncbi:universal stress protein [Hydrogenophaga sp.]|uniref:universal stress protein n=1 Tax=Hydrogenophaga sp. TaxID=1904254 RepID=UPI002721D94D|nr:universal stress protein [Hydrogenophaga sp.]MDO9438497.1 universal stress protein [Hydrogenophaga sp.]
MIYGDAATCILEQAEEQGADLIVLGKHGIGMTEELLLGSVTQHVLAQARSDVLVAAR